MSKGSLILANGQSFNGSLLAPPTAQLHGEVVFTTAMTGYEESLTDPSYRGQILVFTYPLFGNYGVSRGRYWESDKIQVHAAVCANLIDFSAHHAAAFSLPQWFKQQGVPLLSGVDTRALTRILQQAGGLSGYISSEHSVAVAGTCLDEDNNPWAHVTTAQVKTHGHGRLRIILVDCGVKHNIVRQLLNFDVTIVQVPYDYDYSHEDFDGVFISNGPGDPALCQATIKILQQAMKQRKPIFGICLGAQLLALAAGATTYKLKYGHRGHNQPVIELASKRAWLTAQNHGYAINEQSLSPDWEVSFRHLNDQSVAGISHRQLPWSAVQFHPEAASGPQDTQFLFARFMAQVAKDAR